LYCREDTARQRRWDVKKFLLVIFAVTCGVLLWYRVADGARSVRDVVAHAPQLIGREATVSGVAGNSIAILGVGGYEITGEDGSTLTVISSQGVPLAGTHVTVHGVLRQAFVSGAMQKLVLIQDPPESKEAHPAP
jgi:hypothetical protein